VKTIINLKSWPPLIVVGLVFLFSTVLPFADKVARLLSDAVTQLAGTARAGVSIGEYAIVTPLLGQLAPTAGSRAEVALRLGLGIVAAFTGVGVLIELARLVHRHYRQRPETWICHACSAGNHQQCRGALLLVSRAREGARPCQCERCALNR
jgi:hypothetical protein